MRWQSSIQAVADRLVGPAALAALLIVAGLIGLGCEVPAQIVWSPDGARAAYRSGNTAFLLDDKGTVLQPLGTSMGGFAWSADGKSLYFASAANAAVVPAGASRTSLHPEWLGPPNNPTTEPVADPATGPATQCATDQSAESQSVTTVSVLRNGKTTALFRLADVIVWHLQLSPNGQWLAAITSVNKNDGSDDHRLYVFSIRGGALYELSQFCGMGACFTGPNQLAFIEASGLDDVGKVSGHIVRVKLDDTLQTLPRETLVDVILPLTGWMEGCPDGVLFTASPRIYPGPPTADGPSSIFKLFHLTCVNGGLTVLSDDVGELFEVSPDGKRILFEKLTPPEPAATCPTTGSPTTDPTTSQPTPIRDELCVMNANGSNPYVLRSLDDYVGTPAPPMWPAWRGNDQITFIAPADQAKHAQVDKQDATVMEVIQYRLTEKGALEPIKILSSGWKPEMKPYSKGQPSSSK
jgi:hypothetical protein